MNKPKMLMVLFFAFALLPGALASPVDLQASLSNMQACPCTSVNQILTVTNKGPVTDTYSLSSDSTWVTFAGCDAGSISNNEVVLAAGESSRCSVFVTPPCSAQAGDAKITFKASSQSAADTASKQVAVSVLQCHALFIEASDVSVCVGSGANIPFTVRNAGKYAEDVAVKSSVQGTLDSTKFSLGPGETRVVNFAFRPDKTTDTVFTADSESSYAVTTKTVKASVADCYTFTAEMAPQTSLVCLRAPARFNLTIRNTGTRMDIYQISVPGAAVSLNRTALNASESRTVTITALPSAEGKFSAKAVVESVAKESKKEASATVDVKECGSITTTPDKNSKSVCKGEKATFSVSIKNAGANEELYDLATSMGVLDVVKVLVKPGETKNVALNIDTANLDFKTYAVNVSISAGSLKDRELLTLEVAQCYKADLTLLPTVVNLCPGDVANYTAVLKNTGRYSDTFSVVAAGMTLGSGISVAPNETRRFDFAIAYNDVPGIYRVDANATSTRTQSGDRAALVLISLNSCFGSELRAKEAVKRAVPAGIALAEFDLKNTGREETFYNLSVSGPEWVQLGVNTVIRVAQNETSKVYLYLNPPSGTEQKSYPVTLFAVSSRGAISSANMTVDLGTSTTTTTIATTTTATRPDGSRNTLVLGIIIAVAVVLLVRYVIFKK